jgi:DUF4097 and DUF4098 domain-containing protein YvlB
VLGSHFRDGDEVLVPMSFPFRVPPNLAALACLAFAAAGPAHADGSFEAGAPAGYSVERSEQVLRLGGGQRVIARNDFGDVRARFGGYVGDLEILAVLQQFANEGPKLDVQTRTEGETLIVDVGYANAAGERVTKRTPGQRRRVDLVLLVPEKSPLDVVTSHGLIQLRGLTSDVTARSESGEIQLRSIRGNIDVATGSGEILAALPAQEREQVQRIRTESGDLRLIVAEDGHFRIDSTGDGLVSTEFPLRFDTGVDGVRQSHVVVGKGVTPVAVHAGSGHLRIERKPSAQLAADHSGDES